MAYVNALQILSTMACVPEVKELHVITDSSVVAALIDVYKFQKHCEEVVRYWRENVKPAFPALEVVKITTVAKEVIAGDDNKFQLLRLSTEAHSELGKQRELSI